MNCKINNCCTTICNRSMKKKFQTSNKPIKLEFQKCRSLLLKQGLFRKDRVLLITALTNLSINKIYNRCKLRI